MKQLDDFDIKFETLGKSTDNRFLRDSLSATAFVKEVNLKKLLLIKAMKTEDYCDVFCPDSEKESFPIIYEISENITCDIKDSSFFDENCLKKLEQNSMNLIGEENLDKIMKFYSKLVNEEPELTDDHSLQLNDYINKILCNQDKETYIKVSLKKLF